MLLVARLLLLVQLVAGIAMAVGPFQPYRTGYIGVGAVDGTDNSDEFLGFFTVVIGGMIVILAIVGLARSSRDPQLALLLSVGAGVLGLVGLGLTLADLTTAQDANELWGGSIGNGIRIAAVGAIAAGAVGAMAGAVAVWDARQWRMPR